MEKEATMNGTKGRNVEPEPKVWKDSFGYSIGSELISVEDHSFVANQNPQPTSSDSRNSILNRSANSQTPSYIHRVW